jgi:hypothetical protein
LFGRDKWSAFDFAESESELVSENVMHVPFSHLALDDPVTHLFDWLIG